MVGGGTKKILNLYLLVHFTWCKSKEKMYLLNTRTLDKIFKRKMLLFSFSILELQILSINHNDPVMVEAITTGHLKYDRIKYILMWTKYWKPVYVKGRRNFVEPNCPVQDCFITAKKNYFKDISSFDVILFFGADIFNKENIPREASIERKPYQNYIFLTYEPAHIYPMCIDDYNGFFNITWTYKLNSDLVAPYFVIRDKEGEIIGPKEEMHWLKVEDMNPINKYVKNKLRFKYKAAAWLVSRCTSKSGREHYVRKLQEALNIFGLSVDIYGSCGTKRCGQTKLFLPDCWERIQNDYYFYLSFENSFSTDYVTEKLFNPLIHYTVPVVYGAANYTRFMPDGTYLNAMQLEPYQLAMAMNNIIRDKRRYHGFFKWHNHYSYHDPDEAPTTNSFCKLCEMLHDEEYMGQEYVYDDIGGWFNGPEDCTLNDKWKH